MDRHNFFAWKVLEENFPKNASKKEKINFFLRYAILSPSAHNSQPWIFKFLDNDSLIIYLDKKRMLVYSDKTGRQNYISIGTCIENISIAANNFGFLMNIDEVYNKKKFDDEFIPVVKLSFFEDFDDKFENFSFLFPFITKRHSYKLDFLNKKIPNNFIINLNKVLLEKNISLLLFEGNDKKIISNLVVEGTYDVFSDKKFRFELADWTRTNITRKYDGMPGYTMGFPLIPSFFASIVLKLLDVSPVYSKKTKKLIENSPFLGVLTLNDDSILGWINIGRSLQRFWLFATSLGLGLSPLEAPIESEKTLKKFNFFIGKNTKAQILFRFGYPKFDVEKSPRINIEEKIIF